LDAGFVSLSPPFVVSAARRNELKLEKGSIGEEPLQPGHSFHDAQSYFSHSLKKRSLALVNSSRGPRAGRSNRSASPNPSEMKLTRGSIALRMSTLKRLNSAVR
jgi:hypothetical protein